MFEDVDPLHAVAGAAGVGAAGFGAYLAWVWLNIKDLPDDIRRLAWISKNCGAAALVVIPLFRFLGLVW